MGPTPTLQPVLPDKHRQVTVIEKSKARESIWTIPQYRVIFHNDDVTTFKFVALAAETYFKMPPLKALGFAFEVDREGSACAGVFSQEVAELKKQQTEAWARVNQFPLALSIEPEVF